MPVNGGDKKADHVYFIVASKYICRTLSSSHDWTMQIHKEIFTVT